MRRKGREEPVAAKQVMSKWPTLILCCVVAAAIAPELAQAQQGLRPEPPPRGSGPALHPEAPPAAVAPQTSSSPRPSAGVALPLTGHATLEEPAAVSVPASPPVSAVSSQSRPRASETRRTRSAPTRQAPSLRSWMSWPWRSAASAFGAAHASPSPGSSIPLVAGLALLALAIGEAAFLGLAATVFGIERRRPQDRRSFEASYPIRRVLPRR